MPYSRKTSIVVEKFYFELITRSRIASLGFFLARNHFSNKLRNYLGPHVSHFELVCIHIILIFRLCERASTLTLICSQSVHRRTGGSRKVHLFDSIIRVQ